QGQAWRLPEEFFGWVLSECGWFNSLVDCIVTLPDHGDEPRGSQTQTDPLLVCAEPYCLWALEVPNQPRAQARGSSEQIPELALRAGKSNLFTHPALHVTDDIAPFFLRKVRILNGTHTAMVGKFLGHFETVQELVADKIAARWVRDLMYEEIVPTLAY